jgi:hypothetical protein
MTTVAQMIEWMKTLPQDAEVECGVQVSRGYETHMTMQSVDIECCYTLDYRDPLHQRKYPEMAGKVLVMIHGE